MWVRWPEPKSGPLAIMPRHVSFVWRRVYDRIVSDALSVPVMNEARFAGHCRMFSTGFSSGEREDSRMKVGFFENFASAARFISSNLPVHRRALAEPSRRPQRVGTGSSAE
jgi:hypothetical protein